MLQELQREVKVKESVLQQSVQALNDVVSERESTLTQPEQVLLTEKHNRDFMKTSASQLSYVFRELEIF